MTGTVVAQSPCFLYLFISLDFWNGADQRLDRSCDSTSLRPPLPFVSPADWGQFLPFFFAKPCQLEAFHSEDIGFLFLNRLECGEAPASVICRRRPILSQRASSRKDIPVLPSSLSAFAFYFFFNLICSQTPRLLGRSGQQSGGLARWTRVPRGAARMFQLTASSFFPDSWWSCPSVALQRKKKNGTLSSLFAPSCQICWLPCKSAREVLTSCLYSDLLFYLQDTFDFTKETNKSPTDLDKTASLALCFQPPAKTDARVAATLVWT